MKDIEEMLETASQEHIDIPLKVEHRIQYTLRHKNKNDWRFYMRKIFTVMASMIIVLIGSVSVYAAFGGTIEGKLIFEWIGIKFSDEYEDYKVKVEGQEITYDQTKIDLVSTVGDEGFTILEFDIKLSKKDKEYLRLGESIVTEEDLQQAKEMDEKQYNGTGETPNYDHMLKAKDTLNTLELIFFGQIRE